MIFLISLYDNALIYYPNIFFAVLFFISVLGIVAISIGTILLGKEIKRVLKKIKSNLREKEKIGREEKRKASYVQMVRALFQRKSILPAYIIRALTVFFVRMVRVLFIRINTALEYSESQTEKIIEKIEKEIFIKE